MELLPAYVALQPWASGRRVLVVAPAGLEGARMLHAAGATTVRIVESSVASQPGIEVSAAWPEPHDRFDLIVAVESYAHQSRSIRERWLQQAAGSLLPSGWFAALVPHGRDGGEAQVDFWTLERELGRRFAHVFMLAQLPWRGVSFAPVLEDNAPAPGLELDESLVSAEPEASHYFALASMSAPVADVRRRLAERCLLVPGAASGSAGRAEALDSELAKLRDALSEAQSLAAARADRVAVLELEAEVEAERREEQSSQHRTVQALQHDLGKARDDARKAQTDLQILTRQVQDLEAAVARANEATTSRQNELDVRHRELDELRQRTQALEAERASVSRQMEVALAEREGTHKLAQRVEAELDLARRRVAEQDASLSQRADDVARMTTDLEVTRAELAHQRSLLAEAQSREEALSAEAAQTVEQSRMLAEVVADRDRLRDELGRRGQQIQTFEERLWSSREDLEKARLDNVRIAGEAERLRDQAERAHQSEADKAKQLERLGAELHRLELQRAELQATVRAHEAEIGRLRAETESRADEGADAGTMRVELSARTRELADLRARLGQISAREQEALSLARRREQQLSEVGDELERLRKTAEEHASTAASLEGELEVRALEVEQLAASVADLQTEVDTRREAVDTAQSREEGLQRALEHARGEEESLRRRLREREQELEDIAATHESSGLELYKLRRELEAAAEANEQLEQALEQSWPSEAPDAAPRGAEHWPPEAVDTLRRLKGQLAAQARRHTEQLAARAHETGSGADPRVERYRLEARVRSEEQEHMLRELDAAEQKIWEMTDAADRNAARLAASLAQLEKNREELDETRDELEVARKLLAAAEARALEQERLLASERARLARIGAGPDPEAGFDEVDDLFADLAGDGAPMVELDADVGAPVRHLRPDSGPSAAAQPGAPHEVSDPPTHPVAEEDAPRAPRMVVETLEDDGNDDPWETGVVTASPKKA